MLDGGKREECGVDVLVVHALLFAIRHIMGYYNSIIFFSHVACVRIGSLLLQGLCKPVKGSIGAR